MDSSLTALVLFPPPEEAYIANFFARRGYDVLSVIVGSTVDEPSSADRRSIVLAADTEVRVQLDRLGSLQKERVLKPQMIIHHAGADFFSPSVDGEGREWRLKRSPEESTKVALVDWLLERTHSPERSLWINLFSGEHGLGAPPFCSGRYALTGFQAAVQWSPRLRTLDIVNLCLTYFDDPAGAARCAQCVTSRHASAIVAHGGGIDALLMHLHRRYSGAVSGNSPWSREGSE